MRRWGFGLAGLLALALFAGLANVPTDSSDSNPTTQSQPLDITTTETSSSPSQAPEETTSPSPTVNLQESTENAFGQLLAQLVIEDERPEGYDRDLFRHWVDADKDGCDARREVLIMEAVEQPIVGEGCKLSGGAWSSAYDGLTTTDTSTFDIDHMIALKEAWDSGAFAWDSDKRMAFANDLDLPEALIAVSASSNRSKSDRDPSDWMPPLESYHCQYIRDWMTVKIKWELSVDAKEFGALRTIASGC